MGTPYGKYRDEALYSKVLGVLCDCKPRTEREIRRELGFNNRNQRLGSLITGLPLQPEPIRFDGETFVIAEEDDGRVFLVPTGGNSADSC